MKKIFIFLFSFILIASLCLTSCSDDDDSLPEGARTIDGSYATTETYFDIGYIFTTDGFGYQFIGEEVYQIKYYILGNTITIENFSVDNVVPTTFTFSEGDNFIIISGIKYTKFESSDDASIAVVISEA